MTVVWNRPACGFVMLALLMACPMDDEVAPDASVRDAGATPDSGPQTASRPSHSALVSLQNLTVLNTQSSGLTLQALFAQAVKPSYEELPGQPTGCKVWSYDVAMSPPPDYEDHGALTIRGVAVGELSCRFESGTGYACQAGDQRITGVPTPVPEPFAGGPVTIELSPATQGALSFAAASITPGEPFELDEASRGQLVALPLDGSAVSFGCDGPGGTCGAAQATIVRISASDGPTDGLPAEAMPKPRRRLVEISCATLGSDRLTIPAEAMAWLHDAHQSSPLTRIRTAVMRDGVHIAPNQSGNRSNTTILAVGHGFIGFTQL